MAETLDPLLVLLQDFHGTPDIAAATGVLEGAGSVYLWGRSRPVVDSVLYSLARRIDPEFAWIHILDRSRADSVDQLLATDIRPWANGTISVQPRDLVPRPAIERAALSWLVVADDDPVEFDRLRDFLALPDALQEAVGRPVRAGASRVVAVPSSDRLVELFSGKVESMWKIAQILKDSSVSVLVSATTDDSPLRDWFDYSFEVRAEDLTSWQDGSLVCERIPGRPSTAPETTVPLTQLWWATDVLTAASKAEMR
jgi:hypothetical protein